MRAIDKYPRPAPTPLNKSRPVETETGRWLPLRRPNHNHRLDYVGSGNKSLGGYPQHCKLDKIQGFEHRNDALEAVSVVRLAILAHANEH